MIDLAARATWRELEDRLRPFVARRVACEADVDDVMQEVFLRARRSLPDVRDEERLVSWLFAVARTAVLDQHRRGRHHVLTEIPPVAEVGAEADVEPDAEAMLASCIAGFVARLPEPYRAVVTLTELEEMPHREAAAVLGLSLSCVKSRVQRGRQALRLLFDECCSIALDVRGGVLDCEARPRSIPHCRCEAAASPEASSRRAAT